MRAPLRIRFLRVLGLSLIGLAFPFFGWGIWSLMQLFAVPVSAAVYIVSSFAIAGGVTVFLLGSSAARFIPSKKDEEIARLLQLQEEYLTLYDHSPVPYITLDRHGLIKMQNLAAVRLFDTTTDGLLGIQVNEVFVQTEDSDPTKLQSAILENRSVSDLEVQIRTGREAIRWVKASLLVFGGGRENLLSLVDITKAKEVDTAKSEFVALATHQLRTPLAAIRWNTELLEQEIAETLSSPGQDYLTKLNRNVLRMGDLINDFLSASQLEMGTFSTTEKKIALADYFDGIIDEFSGRINSNALTVTRSYDPPDAAMVIDPRLLHIMVSNLVSNAVKYTPNGKTVDVSYQVSGVELTITIADSGIGIPEAEQSKLFSKFFRAANAREKQAEGTGLGLYVVEQSVHKLHGRITCKSSADVGTTFTITIPYQAG